MKRITDFVSGGKLKNISILDLSAFGSKVARLELNQKQESNWPTEINFAILKDSMRNVSAVFTQYKKLLGLWSKYMKNLDKPDSDAVFEFEMGNTTFFNFTRYIKEDMDTFLKEISGSFPTTSRETNSLWKNAAHDIFGHTKHDDYVRTNGLYDKLVVDCTFKKNLLKKEFAIVELDGGCDNFLPTLTSNGMCQTFNGLRPLESWKSAEVVNVFTDVFPKLHIGEKFGGAGIAEG